MGFSNNAGANIQALDKQAYENGEHLRSGIQLNVYLPVQLLVDRSACQIQVYTRCEPQNQPLAAEFLEDFRNQAVALISKYIKLTPPKTNSIKKIEKKY